MINKKTGQSIYDRNQHIDEIKNIPFKYDTLWIEYFIKIFFYLDWEAFGHRHYSNGYNIMVDYFLDGNRWHLCFFLNKGHGGTLITISFLGIIKAIYKYFLIKISKKLIDKIYEYNF